MIEKRWIRTIVVFVATGVLLIAQDFVRDEKPPKLEPPKEIVARVKGQAAAAPYVLEGTVGNVIDGDTFSLRTDRSGEQRVRLASIDAPERNVSHDKPGQPFGDQAQQFLAQRVQGANVRLNCYEQDPYERHVCDVQDPQGGPETINRVMVSEGLAWANMEGKGKFLRDDAMTGLQEQAKLNKAGLWSQPEPVAPWVWRYQCWRNGQCG